MSMLRTAANSHLELHLLRRNVTVKAEPDLKGTLQYETILSYSMNDPTQFEQADET